MRQFNSCKDMVNYVKWYTLSGKKWPFKMFIFIEPVNVLFVFKKKVLI